MANKINAHVTRLHRYLPFTPAHDQIYEEYQKSGDNLNLPTKALDYIKSALADGAKVIVLTGDAGHGKTHLCRRLLEVHLGYNEDDARNLINTKCDGKSVIAPAEASSDAFPLRMYKDFSELEIDAAARSVDEAVNRNDAATVICANEGRLRAVLQSDNGGVGCAELFEEFTASFRGGLTSRAGKVHIINLNFQSIASGTEESLAGQALQEWLSGNRWRICQECDSANFCPIYLNRNFLYSQSNEQAKIRRDRLETIFGTLERLGAVITIREMLMGIAYLLTGGLDCKQVHHRTRLETVRRGWQHIYSFYNLLFERPADITPDMLGRIPVMLRLPQLDPGRRGDRHQDELLLNGRTSDGSEIDLIFEYETGPNKKFIDASNGIDDIEGYPKNRNDRRKESDFVQAVVRSLRRKAYFESPTSGEELKRLGFERGEDFLSIVGGKMSPVEMTRLKNHLVSGLHTAQGLQTKPNETNLHIVDPAFGKATGHAAIISKKIPISKLKLISQSQIWSHSEADRARSMSSAVNWIERQVVLRVEIDAGSVFDFPFDLLTFDCIARAAGGFLAEDFYAHDVRKISSFLAKLSDARGHHDEDISLFMHGRLRSVSIDGGIIQVGGL